MKSTSTREPEPRRTDLRTAVQTGGSLKCRCAYCDGGDATPDVCPKTRHGVPSPTCWRRLCRDARPLQLPQYRASRLKAPYGDLVGSSTSLTSAPEVTAAMPPKATGTKRALVVGCNYPGVIPVGFDGWCGDGHLFVGCAARRVTRISVRAPWLERGSIGRKQRWSNSEGWSVQSIAHWDRRIACVAPDALLEAARSENVCRAPVIVSQVVVAHLARLHHARARAGLYARRTAPWRTRRVQRQDQHHVVGRMTC